MHRYLTGRLERLGREVLIRPELKEVAMERGLLIALSPDEEETLRKIAHGMMHPRSLRDRDVDKLVRFDLVERRRIGISVTTVGLQCLGGAGVRPQENDGAAA